MAHPPTWQTGNHSPVEEALYSILAALLGTPDVRLATVELTICAERTI